MEEFLKLTNYPEVKLEHFDVLHSIRHTYELSEVKSFKFFVDFERSHISDFGQKYLEGHTGEFFKLIHMTVRYSDRLADIITSFKYLMHTQENFILTLFIGNLELMVRFKAISISHDLLYTFCFEEFIKNNIGGLLHGDEI